MVSALNLVCGRFINFEKGRKFLTLLTFGCPGDDVCRASYCVYSNRRGFRNPKFSKIKLLEISSNSKIA